MLHSVFYIVILVVNLLFHNFSEYALILLIHLGYKWLLFLKIMLFPVIIIALMVCLLLFSTVKVVEGNAILDSEKVLLILFPARNMRFIYHLNREWET